MEQIQKLKAELEQVQKDLTWYYTKSCKKGCFNRLYVNEINQLGRRRRNLEIKINQLRQKHWYWEK